jgi:hypothetical protein
MKHLQLFEEFIYVGDHLNEDLLADIVAKAKKGAAAGALVAALLGSPDVSAQDKTAIQQANQKTEVPQEANGVGVGLSPDLTFSKDISFSRAIADLAKNLPDGTTLSYEVVDQKTVMEGKNYKTTTILKISADGTKVTPSQLTIKKKLVVRDDARLKRESHMENVNAELLARAKRFGFATLEEYWAWQAERNKGEDVGMDNLNDPSFSHGKCGISKAGAKDAKREWKKK